MVPFGIEEDENGIPTFDIPSKGKRHTAQEITVMIIGWLKELAEKRVKKTVHSAVIAVPFDFDGPQRQAVYKASSIAGFHQTKVVDSISAVTASFSTSKPAFEGILVIFDLGASQLDMSVLVADGSSIEVKLSRRAFNLGGNSFNQKILEFCKDIFKK